MQCNAAQVSANPIEEDHLIMEAIQLAQQRKFDNARDVAESVLQSNPNNATAIQVNASECESRQDWGTAVCVPDATLVVCRLFFRVVHALTPTHGRPSFSCLV